MTWKIIVDSASDWRDLPNLAPDTHFVNVPLTIQVGDEIFVDDANLDIDQMMATMANSSQGAGSACPSPEAYKQALDGADKAIIITITGALSGSFNAARLGSEMYLEEHPEAQVHVIDSLSAGGEMDLLALKVNELITAGKSFDEVVAEMTSYQEKTKLLFVLAKVDNLVKNGRLSKVIGAAINLLNIRMVGQASDEGKLELLQKARGHKKSITASVDEMIKAGYQGGRIIIAHRQNDKFCQQFSEALTAKFPDADILVLPTTGLCSFYAEEGGVMIGYDI